MTKERTFAKIVFHGFAYDASNVHTIGHASFHHGSLLGLEKTVRFVVVDLYAWERFLLIVERKVSVLLHRCEGGATMIRMQPAQKAVAGAFPFKQHAEGY
tara:strand:+ start:9247 stop:9546 length:300 start_codon:yes stop_codon:yes gene_type:complete